MHTHLQRLAAIAALAIGATACGTLPALAQEHHDDAAEHQRAETNQYAEHPDYSNNRYYRLGNQEGVQDHRRNTQRANHNHKYKTDDDRKAHDYGYQEGWQGKSNRDNQRDPH
jgi:hypothetical protein